MDEGPHDQWLEIGPVGLDFGRLHASYGLGSAHFYEQCEKACANDAA